MVAQTPQYMAQGMPTQMHPMLAQQHYLQQQQMLQQQHHQHHMRQLRGLRLPGGLRLGGRRLFFVLGRGGITATEVFTGVSVDGDGHPAPASNKFKPR
jgi:hypothetical protein